MPTENPVQPHGGLIQSLPVGKVAADFQKRVEHVTAALTESTNFVDSLKGKSVEDLTSMAADERDATLGYQRKAAVHAFRLGAILHRIRKLKKPGKGWSLWLDAHNWNVGTANRYINLYEAVKKESSLEGMLIGEAEQRFVKKVKSKVVPRPDT